MRFVTTLLRRLRGEQGFVMPTAAVVLALAVLTAGVAATQTITAQDGSVHEKYAKRALQAADAGLEAARYRMNRLGVSRLSDNDKCITVLGASGEVTKTAKPAGTYTWDGASTWNAADPSAGWCGAVTGQTDDGASYSYRVSAEATPSAVDQTIVRRMIVSTGTYQGISRRVATVAEARRAVPLFTGDFAAFSHRDFTINSNSIVGGNAGSNGNITLNGNAQVCAVPPATGGNATPGPGKTVTVNANAEVCGSTAPAPAPYDLPPLVVDLTNNDNNRICAAGMDACTDTGSITWNPTTRYLKLDSNSTLTLGGSVYAFCYLELSSNSQIIIPPRPAGSPVKVYIEAPESCPYTPAPATVPGVTSPHAPDGWGSMLLNSNAKIVNQNADAISFQVYMLGSPNRETAAVFDSNAQATEVKFAFYAPFSEVTLNSNVTFRGAFAAAHLGMDSNSRIIYDESVEDIETEAVYPQLRSTRWVECTRAPTTAGHHGSGC